MSGVWSETLFSNHSTAGSFTITVLLLPILKDGQGACDCQTVTLLVTAGQSYLWTGNFDSTGKVLRASYILNGSASGKCETDELGDESFQILSGRQRGGRIIWIADINERR